MKTLLQIYAPTTLAPARDFWTLRYTTNLDNGSLVVSSFSAYHRPSTCYNLLKPVYSTSSIIMLAILITYPGYLM